MKKRVLILALLSFISCVSENQTYLIACPTSNQSSLYPVSSVRQGWVKQVGTLEILFDNHHRPAKLLNGCEWIFVDDELLDATVNEIEAYGNNIWWYGQKIRGL